MDERKKFLFVVISVFVWTGSLLVWGGWWAVQKDDVAVTSASAESRQSKKGGVVTIPLYEEVPQTIRPLSPANEATEIVLNFIYEPLVEKQPDGTVKGVLADKWRVQDDGRSVTVHLREGVEWHNGEAFTVDDVSYTYRQLANSDYKGEYQETVRLIKGVKDVQSGKAKTIAGINEVKGKRAITFHLNEPLSNPAELLQIPIIPRHMDGDSEDNLAVTQLVGTGPYRVAARSEQNAMELERFPHYWDEDQPYLDLLSLKTMTMGDAISHFQQGKLDILPQLDAALSETVLSEPGMSSLQQSGDVFHYIAFNPQQTLWQDMHTRLAVGQVLDKQQIVQDWLGGYGVKVDTPRGTQVQHSFGKTLKKASSQLQKQNLSLHYSSEWIDRDALAKLLQKQWKAVNIKVKLEEHKDVKGLMQAIHSGEADMFLMTDWVRTQPDKLLDWWVTDNLQAWTHWPVKKVRSTLDQAAATDGKERENRLREWDELFTEEAPMIPLVRPHMFYFVDENLRGVKAEDFGPDGVDIRNWHVSNYEQLARNRP